MQDYPKLTKEAVLEKRNMFLSMYPSGIPYDLCFIKLSDYLTKSALYQTNVEVMIEYLGFLYALKYIESTIPTYESYITGVNNHNNWLMRTIQYFFRANVEETEVKDSPEGRALNLEFRYNPTNPNDRFHCGAGNNKADLYSPVNGEYYDVKHNTVAYDKIHEGHFIIKYQDDSNAAMLYDKNLAKDQDGVLVGGYTFKTFTVTPLRVAFNERGIPGIVLDIHQEKQLENFFGFIDLDIK